MIRADRLLNASKGWILAATLGLGGCLGGGDGKGGGDGGAGAGGAGGVGGSGGFGGFGGDGSEFGQGNTAPEQYYKDLAGVMCDVFLRCCPGGVPGFVTTRNQCVDFVVAQLGGELGTVFASGKVGFDSAAASRCLSAVRQVAGQVSCNGAGPAISFPESARADCEGAVVGRQGEGESCVLSEDEENSITSSSGMLCQPGLGCYAATPEQFGDPTCGPRGAVGAACPDDEACEQDLYCDFNSAQCAAKVADGTECGSSDQCLSDHCDFDQSPAVCAPEPNEGGGMCPGANKGAGGPAASLRRLFGRLGGDARLWRSAGPR